jgi:acetyl-CoA carboxylase biotin carboxyl carrier protein
MDIRTIKALAKILQESNLSVLEVTEGDMRIRLESSSGTPVQPAGMPAIPMAPEHSTAGDAGIDFNDITVVEAPMVGVFYGAPGPGQPPFVKVGSQVKKGDVLCIIEAMKLMNEITAETDGEIVDICVNDGDVVEFGQTLFKIF